MKKVYIVSAVRTPMGSWGGALSKFSATDLGAFAISGALEKAGVAASEVQEVFMGNVCSANLGQAPARQASIKAGISDSVPCTTVNKVCSSGMKAVMFAAQSIMLGMNDVAVAGGMESMSNIPFYAPTTRWGSKFGHTQMVDGLVKDGLTDVYNNVAMGVCADATAKEFNITREAQDEYAIRSYKRSAATTESGKFQAEIVPISIPQRRGEPIIMTEDEEFRKVKFEKVPALRPAFSKDGTVTAANASTINDGAAALVLMSEEKVKELGLTPLAEILSFADAAQAPEWFTTAPTLAAPKALERAGLTLEDVDFFEVNEAFSVVSMAFCQKLGFPEEKMNVYGGAVSLGHPLGTSGARILCTLNNVLHQESGSIGLAAICNGGGGASAMVIKKM